MQLHSQSTPRPLVSVVVTVFNEAGNIPVLIERLTTTLEGLACGWEIVFVDDGSSDESSAILVAAHQADQRICLVRLSRNFGHEAACLAGLDAARGEAIVLMDADLQDPPELIADFVTHWRSGAEVVVAQRTKRSGDGPGKRFAAFVYYRVMSRLVPWRLPQDVGNYRLMDRRVVEAIRVSADHAPVVRALAAWTGFRQEVVGFDRSQRHSGKTKYSLSKNISIAWWFLTGYTTVPLRLGWFLMIAACVIGTILTGVAIVRSLTGDAWEVWAVLGSVWLAVGFISGHIAVVGEYTARTTREAIARPQYIVHSTYGIRPGDRQATKGDTWQEYS